MGLKGIMTINGKEYKNAITSWGISSLFSAMFDNVAFPLDLYLTVCGYRRGMTPFEGVPNPYDGTPINNTIGYEIGNNVAPWSFSDMTTEPDGSISPGQVPPLIAGDYRSFFEFTQDTPTRVKLTPFHIEGTRVTSEEVIFNCSEAELLGQYTGDMAVFYITDSQTQFNNESNIFSSLLCITTDPTLIAIHGYPTTVNLAEGTTFSYSFELS